MIELDDVSVRYAHHLALDHVSLRITPGEFVLLTGPSGCGKTTLARTLNGLIPHTLAAELEGHVYADGLDTREHSVAELATRVGMVFQIPETQLFNLSVEDEVAFGPQNLDLAESEVAERVAWALEAVGLQNFNRRKVEELSGGEKQRLAIAAVLAMRPRMLMLDEPLANLDAQGAEMVLETLRGLYRQGITILLIEHKTTRVWSLATRALVMAEGRIVRDGPPQTVFAEREYLHQLGVRLPGPLSPLDAMSGRGASSGAWSKQAISLRDVSFCYRRQPVLKDVSLDIQRGEFVALVGDNGAGKSTLARIILGLLKPSAGTVWVAHRNDRVQLGREVSLLLQNPLEQLFCDTVTEEIAFGLENFGLPVAQAVEQALMTTGLRDKRTSLVSALSSGEHQRLALAAVLALEPDILILDEPTLGQDWGHLTRFMASIVDLNRRGTTVLLITHDMEMIQAYARRVVRLKEGRLISDERIEPVGAGGFGGVPLIHISSHT